MKVFSGSVVVFLPVIFQRDRDKGVSSTTTHFILVSSVSLQVNIYGGVAAEKSWKRCTFSSIGLGTNKAAEQKDNCSLHYLIVTLLTYVHYVDLAVVVTL